MTFVEVPDDDRTTAEIIAEIKNVLAVIVKRGHEVDRDRVLLALQQGQHQHEQTHERGR